MTPIAQQRPVTLADINGGIKQAVAAVMLATAYAETMREQVDTLKRAELAEIVYLVAPENLENGRTEERITDPRHDWLMSTQDFADYCRQLDTVERKAGLKPDTMPAEHCPALVAEEIQRTAEQVLIECAEPVFGVKLDQATRNLDDYRKYVDLLCGLVVKLPDFKHPLTGKAVTA